ncbi:MAG TPA: hypothetical protein VGI45_13605 [Terracidiphilus sp.]|jgi:GNAT superfamily N-acetyltransferase
MLAPFDAAQLRSHAADVHLCVLGAGGEAQAHCSLWWKRTAELSGHTVGVIGHFATTDEEAAAALLDRAVARLQENGCTLAVGPMDGNTWRRYRLSVGNGLVEPSEPSFFLEPVNPPEWPRFFERAGFAPIAEYYSAMNRDLAQTDLRLDVIKVRIEAAGVQIRSAAETDLAEELRRIYEVSRIAFAGNFLYTELAESDFVGQYTPLLQRIRPELILLAERGTELVGYLFGLPDFAQTARGQVIDTFLIKTVAILPEPSLRGLGGLLVGLAHQAGHQLGFRRCIHALMHESNGSRNISRHYAETIRRYALYGMEIGS